MDTTTTFSGWHRPRYGTWRKLVTDAPDFASAWAALLDAAQHQPAGESLVLQGVNSPTKRRAAVRGTRP